MQMKPVTTLILAIPLVTPTFANAQTTFTQITEGHIVTAINLSGGCAWGDYNQDGYIDLFVVNGITGFSTVLAADVNHLYKNNRDETFTLIARGDFIIDRGNWDNASWGDYDGDGDLDIFVMNSNGPNAMYANNGDETFMKTTPADLANTNGGAATWGDFDNDGDLDVFIARTWFGGNVLFANKGNGTFTDVTTGDMVTDTDSSLGQSRSANWVDYDNDGDMDLFVANDNAVFTGSGLRNFLYMNNGNATFTKITAGEIVNEMRNSAGGSWGDYDNDGDLDLFVANGTERQVGGATSNSLYENKGDGTFAAIAEGSIVERVARSWGSAWGDFDNDGDLDLLVVPGFVYFNNDDGTFSEEEIQTSGVSLGCAIGDYDNDGDQDIFVANCSQIGGLLFNNFLLRNESNTNHWININCVGLSSPAPQIGTKVRLKATINDESFWQMREIASQTGFLGQNSLRVHFGLGDATVIDSIKIEWLSGNVDIYTNVAVNTFYRAVQGAGLTPIVTSVADLTSGVPEGFELRQNYPNPFNPATRIRYSLSSSSAVTLRVYNMHGKVVLTLVNGELKAAGDHTVSWDSRDAEGNAVASGVYLLRIQAGNHVQTRKMVLVR